MTTPLKNGPENKRKSSFKMNQKSIDEKVRKKMSLAA